MADKMRSQVLKGQELFRGQFYGPGKVEVPEDFPRASELKERDEAIRKRRGPKALRVSNGKIADATEEKATGASAAEEESPQ